jgi:hypothetical protein
MEMTMTKEQAKRREVTGTIISVSLRSFPARDSGRYGSERYDVKALVTLSVDGDTYWFYSPATTHSISKGGPFYVSTVQPCDWITSQEWATEGALGASGFGETPALRVRVGDVVTVQGSVKSEDHRGVRLERVKRLDWSYRALNLAWWTRYEAARSKVPISLPPDQELPAFEGVEWRRIGSPDGTTIRFDSKVINEVALLASIEGVPLAQAQRPH